MHSMNTKWLSNELYDCLGFTLRKLYKIISLLRLKMKTNSFTRDFKVIEWFRSREDCLCACDDLERIIFLIIPMFKASPPPPKYNWNLYYPTYLPRNCQMALTKKLCKRKKRQTLSAFYFYPQGLLSPQRTTCRIVHLMQMF